MTDAGMTEAGASDPARPRLPGELVMWVLIASELAVFGAALLIFLVLRLGDVEGFAAAQAQVHRLSAGLNTVVLVTSGYGAACAVGAARRGDRAAVRRWLGGAALLGAVFLLLKGVEYADAVRQGLGLETHVFFTFYWLLTLFHAAHVVAGMVILGLVAIRAGAEAVEAGAQFWHMVDLVWVLLFPVIYLLR